MGGIGSGRPEGWGRPTVEGVRSINANRWGREGFLRPGLVFAWEWTYTDGNRAMINAEARADEVVLRYRFRANGGEWQPVEEVVPLEWTACRFGGRRAWFRCPRCFGRVVKLYGAGRLFLCRRCHGLTYACQREKWDARASRQAMKIRRRLGGAANFVEPFPRKPKGMHWRTFERLRRHAVHAELVSLAGISQRIDRMYEML